MTKYKLTLHRIKCHENTEWGDDEVYINVSGSKVWGDTKMGEGSVKDINQSYEFNGSISVEVKEEDGGLHGKDDHIGTINFGEVISNNASVKVSGSGASYTVWYSISPPPPPKIQYNPELKFTLTEIQFIKDYYRPIPKQIDIRCDLKCFGIVNSCEKNNIDLPSNGKVTVNHSLGTKTVSFQELVNPLNGSPNSSFIGLNVDIKEYYQWYLPKTKVKFSSVPNLSSRPQDRGVGFQKWVQVNGSKHTQEVNFSLSLGYQYVLTFNVVISFDRTLVHNEGTKVNQYIAAVEHYVGGISSYLKEVEEHVQIDYEIENIDAQPKLTKGKPMKVVKEGGKGRNLHFQDADGFTMNREEFVSAIKQGLYPGYHIRKIRGLETPVSDPDNTTANNLG